MLAKHIKPGDKVVLPDKPDRTTTEALVVGRVVTNVYGYYDIILIADEGWPIGVMRHETVEKL